MPKIDIPDGWLESHPYRYTTPKFESTNHTRVVREEVLKPTTSRLLAAIYNPEPQPQPVPAPAPEPVPQPNNPPNADTLTTKIRIKILLAMTTILIIGLYISAAHPSGRDNIALGLGMTSIILAYTWITGPVEYLFPESEPHAAPHTTNADVNAPALAANNSTSVPDPKDNGNNGKAPGIVAHQNQTNQLWRKEVTYKLERTEVLRLVPETRPDVAVVGNVERLVLGQ